MVAFLFHVPNLSVDSLIALLIVKQLKERTKSERGWKKEYMSLLVHRWERESREAHISKNNSATRQGNREMRNREREEPLSSALFVEIFITFIRGGRDCSNGDGGWVVGVGYLWEVGNSTLMAVIVGLTFISCRSLGRSLGRSFKIWWIFPFHYTTFWQK